MGELAVEHRHAVEEVGPERIDARAADSARGVSALAVPTAQAVPADFAHGRGGQPGRADPDSITALYGRMYGGADAAIHHGGTPAAGAPATPRGLSAYEAVPDDHKGPLKPNQLRKSQLAELRKYDFDKLNVVADPPGKDGALANDQLTQAQFQQLAQAWLNIAGGQGLRMTGSAEDQGTFRRMLRDGLGDSPTLRSLITAIGNDADPSHRIEANLGRSQPRTFVDSFNTGAIDLADLEQFAKTPAADHKNEATRGEQLVHILAERRAAATSADPTDFAAAHQEANRQHNQYRAERGQAAERSAKSVVRDGKTYAVFRYVDGTQHECELNRQHDIVGMNRPEGR